MRSPTERTGFFVDDPVSGQIFAGRLIAIKERKSLIPYGFYSEGRAFDEEGYFQPFSDPAMGLTCATYVIEVFETFGHPIADLTTWRVRETDAGWQQGIVEIMAQHNPGRAEEAKKYIGSIRVRPTEAAGAVISAKTPITFEEAEVIAIDIQALIDGS